MKKILFCFLVFIFALTNGFARQQKIPQADSLRLTIEHKILQHQLDEILQRANKQTVYPAFEVLPKKNPTPAELLSVKPYYQTFQIQQACEKFPQCAAWAKSAYEQAIKDGNTSWQIVEASASELFYEPSALFKYLGTESATYRFLKIQTNGPKKFGKFLCVGKGKNPDSWEESFEIW